MELIAQKRETVGKKIKDVRSERKIPAVMFGKGLDSVPLLLDLNSFIKVYREAGETSLVDLKTGDAKESVLIKDVQLDPVSSLPIHVGFHKVNLKEKITAQIPVEVVGEEENALVKSGDAFVLALLNEITVEALPMDLPSEFVINVAGLLEIGDGVTIGQLAYDKEKVEIVDHEEDDYVIRLDHAQMEEEPEEEVSEEEAIAGVEASEELSEEERKAREEEEKEEKE
jgi:large subunit ribosomal protein L25